MPHAIRRRTTRLAPAIVLALVLSACGSASGGDGADDGGADDATASTTTTTTAAASSSSLFDSSFVHEISVSFDTDEYDAMVDTYSTTGEKDWIEATVTIDGVTIEHVGMRLKGNSSLQGIGGGGRGPAGGASSSAPESLPWLIKFDKYVDGQSYEGLYDLVIRSNNSETSLNEAVALELLDLAGIASQDAIATSFSVNGSDPELRLAIEHPDDVWMAAEFDASGALYKAEATGDYSYRGTDPDSYDEVFDQEAGDANADLSPLIEFLDFINNADDDTFNAELADRLDVDGFATYLAMQELIDNFDDIDGPGNNSYLYYDTETETFTVVAWDHNLAFGGLGGGGFGDGRGGFPGGGEFTPPEGGLPEDGEFTPPEGGVPGDGGGFDPGGFGDRNPGGFGRGGSNILVERFMANDELSALYEQTLEELRAALFDSGAAADVLAEWIDVLETTDLVDATTIETEAASISTYFD